MKRVAVAFTGPSNSGKTTLIIKTATVLIEKGFKVCIVKHDPKDKAQFDTEGKDSYKFSQTKADVAVVSSNKTTLFKQTSSTIDELIYSFGEFDYLLVEGLKTLPLPRIAIFRENLDEDYFTVSDVIATDNNLIKEKIKDNFEVMDLNNTTQIIEWINKNAKKV